MGTFIWGFALLILNIIPALFSGVSGWTILGCSCALYLMITGAIEYEKKK